MKPTERAKAMLKYDDGKISEAKIRHVWQKLMILTLNFILKLAGAKSEAEKLRIRYESYKNLFEAKRSMLSYQKAEMKLI